MSEQKILVRMSRRFIQLKLWLKWHCKPHTDHNWNLVDDLQGNLFQHWQHCEKYAPETEQEKNQFISNDSKFKTEKATSFS